MLCQVWQVPAFADGARAIAICDKVLKHRLVGDRDRSVAKLLSLRSDAVVLWSDGLRLSR